MKLPARYTITAALPYANGPLHIGHMAGVYIPADIYVRYLRLCNRKVAFICGSDEHGAAITLRAKKEGKSPQEIVDTYHAINASAFADFGISFDIYHRTSSQLHHQTAQEFFSDLAAKGSFDITESDQFYDEEARQFLADRYIMGTCPKCGHDSAYGDQCEKCGSTLSPSELINPKSTLSGGTPVLRPTKHWYLPMQHHEAWVREWLLEGNLNGEVHHDPKEWKKQVLGQCKSWLDSGLQPRAMTRDLDWGVQVPLKDATGKVLYVWLDAPIGYVSATRQWAADNGEDWRTWWQDKDTRLIHFLAKDNIVFHCIIFPIILQLKGDYLLPHNVPANEFLNLEGNKISTSRNWAVWLHEYMTDFPGREDELRYVLNAIAPEFRDSEFTWADFQARVNNELVAVLGNFVNRTVVLTGKFFAGKVPARTSLTPLDQENLASIGRVAGEVAAAMEAFRFRDAQQAAMQLARMGNKYLTETEPWKLHKTDVAATANILNVCLQLCANMSILLKPFLPRTCERLEKMLNMASKAWADTGYDLLTEDHLLGEAALLFQKIEDDMVSQQVEKLRQSNHIQGKAEIAPQKEPITFEDFQKMDIRTATIMEAERVPKTSKLLKLRVDTGVDQRTVVSGIAEHYNPEEIIGRKVVMLLNLQPRNIRGVASQGMILMAEDAEGKLCFVEPSSAIGNGCEVR